jgi:hypothetical protein
MQDTKKLKRVSMVKVARALIVERKMVEMLGYAPRSR